MYILGIGDGHDSSASLLCDGKVIACAEEERFVRIKHAYNMFPNNAIKFCLNVAGIRSSDVDFVAYYMDPKKMSLSKDIPHLVRMVFKPTPTNLRNYIIFKYITYPKQKMFLRNLKKMNITPKKIFYVDHHRCHAASAFRMSGFKRATILTMDGRGEWTTTAGYCGKNNEIETLWEIKHPHSLGHLYSFITAYLGFKINNSEWKVMGLSAYGKPTIDFSSFIKITNNGYELSKKYFPVYGNFNYQKLIDGYGPMRIRNSKLNDFHKNMAASSQKTLETVAQHLLEMTYNQTGIKNLCLAGGVAFNCKMNQRLRESGFVENIYIQPAAGDAGTSLGAALEAWAMLGYKSRFKMEHVYYGKDYSNKEIEKTLKTCQLKYEYHKDVSGLSAEMVEKGKIVGWFQGRFEFGPRAMGNRSIIADPRSMKSKDRVNNVVKYREQWRPFAPSMLAEYSRGYLKNPCSAPFMILTFDVKEEKIEDVPAVVHVDGTTRPQTVEKKTNKKYYKLIKNFKKLTGIPIVLNTSFNIRGQPIVNTPHEAIQTFYSTGMDALVLGDYFVFKKR